MMDTRSNQFPLVDDNEQIIQPMKVMSLYEEEDLITNIQGTYQEKNYQDMFVHYQPVNPSLAKSFEQERRSTIDAGKSYAEMAREIARNDIKKKKQIYFDMNRKSRPSKTAFQNQLSATLPKKSSVKKFGDLKLIANKLRQEHYILAEVPIIYKEPKNVVEKSDKKNSYDFLKKSQIYNRTERQEKTGYRVSQELNLTRFEDNK